ncbi:hypothetical protein [Photobacterium sp. DNB22_13_2]
MTIKIDGEVLAEGQVPKTAPAMFSFHDSTDLSSAVSEAYFHDAPFEFEGGIEKVNAKYISH